MIGSWIVRPQKTQQKVICAIEVNNFQKYLVMQNNLFIFANIMKHTFLSIVFFCKIFFLNAQVIQGTVYDSKTREALSGVVIFLDGTSIVTTSDNDGKFLLAVENIINANLVFSHLSYESLVIEKPFEDRREAFFLKEKTNLLNAAVAVAEYDPLSRAEKMKVFKEFFLGESVAAKSCIIRNEDDIMLRYDHPTDILYASVRNPLTIENQHLGYRITADIKYFQVKYTYTAVVSPNRNTVVPSNQFVATASSFAYSITSFFEDQKPYDISLVSRRNQIYVRSRQYFWLSLVNNFALIKSGFKIYNKSKEVYAEDYFTVMDDPIQKAKVVLITPGTNINRKHNEVSEESIYGVIGIRAQNKNDSEVIFLTNQFSVDPYGNVATSGLIYKGDMAHQRVGDMLPQNFIYTPSKVQQRRR